MAISRGFVILYPVNWSHEIFETSSVTWAWDVWTTPRANDNPDTKGISFFIGSLRQQFALRGSHRPCCSGTKAAPGLARTLIGNESTQPAHFVSAVSFRIIERQSSSLNLMCCVFVLIFHQFLNALDEAPRAK